jgi:hypothetical protein
MLDEELLQAAQVLVDHGLKILDDRILSQHLSSLQLEPVKMLYLKEEK